MKQFRRCVAWVCIMLTAMLVLFPASAASKNALPVKTLKTGTWIKADNSAAAYKLTLSKDSVVSYDWKDGNIFIDIYRKRSCTSSSMLTNVDCTDVTTGSYANKGTGKIPLEKGTYYLQFSGDAKVRLSSKPCSGSENYCMARATLLKRNKAATVISFPNEHFRHWFRLNNTANRKLTITITNMNVNSENYVLYNPNDRHNYYTLEDVAVTSKAQKVLRTSEAVKPGTYYLYSGNTYYSLNDRCGYYYTIKWK